MIVAATGKLYPAILDNMSYKKRMYWNLFVKRILKYSFVHFTTEKEKSSCVNSYIKKNKSIIIKTSTNILEKSKEEIKIFQGKEFVSKSDKILFLGRLHPIKGLDLLIKSYFKILKLYPKTSLILSGPDEGEYKNHLIKLIKNLNMNYEEIEFNNIFETNTEGKVVFTGIVNEKEKIWLLSQIDIYCQLSVSEGFSNSIVEAMSMKKSVVISDGCNFDEVRDKNLGLVGKDLDAHILNLSQLLENKDLREKLGQNAYNYIKSNFSSLDIAKKASTDLEKIIRR